MASRPGRNRPLLVLCHRGDPVAAATAAAATALGATVEVVGVEQLTRGASWSHRQRGGETRTILRLADGRRIDSHSIGAVLNRARHAPAPPFPGARDREYAVMETFALLLSWLHSLSAPVVNQPSARGLAGAERSVLEWLRLAATVGLPARRVRFTTEGRAFHLAGMRAYQPPFDHEGRVGTPLQASVPPGPRPVLFAEEVGPTERVLVVGDDIFGTPDSGAEAIRRLAAAANCALLEVEIGRTIARGDRVVCNANPFPDRLAATEAEALAATLIQ